MNRKTFVLYLSCLSLSCGGLDDLSGDKNTQAGSGACGTCAGGDDKSPMGDMDGGAKPPSPAGRTPYFVDADTNEEIGAVVSLEPALAFSPKLNGLVHLVYSAGPIYYTKADCSGAEWLLLRKQLLDELRVDIAGTNRLRLKLKTYVLGPNGTYLRADEMYPANTAPLIYTWTTALGERVCKQYGGGSSDDRLAKFSDTGVAGKTYWPSTPAMNNLKIELR